MTRRAGGGVACCAAAPPRGGGQPRGLGANLGLAVVVVAAPPRPTVIDRYLALVRAGGCAALVCVNKIDLVDQDAVENAAGPYRLPEGRLLLTSALRGGGVGGLRRPIR